MSLTLIAAATTKNGIGRNGTLPWHISRDMAYFNRVTTSSPTAQKNVVLMGRKTWESIPRKFRPLDKRINVVFSRDDDYQLFPEDAATPSAMDETYLYSDLEIAVETFASKNNVHRLFVIGGSSLYQEALALGPGNPNCSSPRADRILMTRLYHPEFDCDVFFPDVLGGAGWRRTTHEEHSAWVGFDIPAGIQTQNGIEFEYQMWVRSSE